MKTNFIIFFSIFIILYSLINYYIFIRGWHAVSNLPAVRIIYLFTFIFVALTYFSGRGFEKYSICVFSKVLIWIGSIWLAYMLYLFLAVAVLDLIRLLDRFFHFIPDWIKLKNNIKVIVAASVFGVVSMCIVIGYLNAYIPRIKILDVSIPKKSGNLKSINIALATDIHLGTIISNSRLNKMVSSINALNPDLVLLGGDIVDEDLAPVIADNLGDQLKLIRSKYGVYAITGNHEYIGGAEEACRYLTEHGVRMIRDDCIDIENSLYLVGREDRSIHFFSGKERKPLDKIISGIDKGRPIILLDHEPLKLNDAVTNDIDLQVSGHTHNGQLWPLNYITGAIFEISYGYKNIKGTQFYVSSGFGTWGPPIRLGNRPEIINLRINFAP